jgi:hypothetical protein
MILLQLLLSHTVCCSGCMPISPHMASWGHQGVRVCAGNQQLVQLATTSIWIFATGWQAVCVR